MRYIVIPILLLAACAVSSAQPEDRINGLSFVAPPSEFTSDPMQEVLSVHANWIAAIPYAYTRLGDTKVRHDISPHQWWGERPEGIRKTIKMAHDQDIQVMLKPQVYIPGSWPGDLTYEDQADWEAWEQSYTAYIMLYIDMAVEMDVAMFCIGTEFRESTKLRPDFWIKLIEDIRARYNGKLTYAANWDDYDQIIFWEKLDFIGIDAYFPLTDEITPAVWDLNLSWKGIMDGLESFSNKHRRNILFTEYGYYSIDGCAGKHWELAENIHSKKINEQAQCNALEALLSTCSSYPCWAGGFLWKWFPDGQGHEGYPERDFTPQGKMAEEKLKQIYKVN